MSIKKFVGPGLNALATLFGIDKDVITLFLKFASSDSEEQLVACELFASYLLTSFIDKFYGPELKQATPDLKKITEESLNVDETTIKEAVETEIKEVEKSPNEIFSIMFRGVFT